MTYFSEEQRAGMVQYSGDDRHSSAKLVEQGYEEIHADDLKSVDSGSVEELKKRDISTLSPIELMSIGMYDLQESTKEKHEKKLAKQREHIQRTQSMIDAQAEENNFDVYKNSKYYKG